MQDCLDSKRLQQQIAAQDYEISELARQQDEVWKLFNAMLGLTNLLV
jgi:hypothetical protein